LHFAAVLDSGPVVPPSSPRSIEGSSPGGRRRTGTQEAWLSGYGAHSQFVRLLVFVKYSSEPPVV